MKASTYQQYREWTRQPGEKQPTDWKARALKAERERDDALRDLASAQKDLEAYQVEEDEMIQELAIALGRPKWIDILSADEFGDGDPDQRALGEDDSLTGLILEACRNLLALKTGIQPDLHRATLELSILEAFNAWQESVPTSGHFWVPRLSRAMYAMRALVQTDLEATNA